MVNTERRFITATPSSLAAAASSAASNNLAATDNYTNKLISSEHLWPCTRRDMATENSYECCKIHPYIVTNDDYMSLLINSQLYANNDFASAAWLALLV